MERKQFTFYQSFREALALIEDPMERLMAYEIIVGYALDGIAPQLDTFPKIVQMAYMLIKPTLESSKRKAQGGMNGTPCKQNEKIGERCRKDHEKEKEVEKDKEKDKEVETEIETEIETETESKSERAGGKAFAWFWAVYPKKIGKEEACREFCKVTEPVEELVRAVKRQKQSVQWQKENGRHIPRPATWLRERRWTDELPMEHEMGELEIQAIQKIMHGSRFTNGATTCS